MEEKDSGSGHLAPQLSACGSVSKHINTQTHHTNGECVI